MEKIATFGNPYLHKNKICGREQRGLICIVDNFNTTHFQYLALSDSDARDLLLGYPSE